MTAINSISFGELLREWRTRRQLSQLQLATRASVSTRHLRYLETGRSQPSRTMIERLAGYLDVPLRERNQLMHAAGLAPTYPERGLDAPESLAVTEHCSRSWMRTCPFPHSSWTAGGMSSTATLRPTSCSMAVRLTWLNPRFNALRLTLHPDGLAPRITNLGQWRSHLLTQVQSRSERDGDCPAP